MKQESKMYSSSCDNKNSIKFDIRTDIKRFQQTMLMEMIEKLS